MISTDRIPCINPVCKRTASIEKYSAGEEIVCAKCWKKLPKALTDRYRALRRRDRQLGRLAKKRIAKGEPESRFVDTFMVLDSQMAANWSAFVSYFTNPPAPAGLENFLKETGLG
jgi:hypothetical protein